MGPLTACFIATRREPYPATLRRVESGIVLSMGTRVVPFDYLLERL